LRVLNEVLPCALCRRHMRDYMAANPLTFPVGATSAIIRDTIIFWLFNFHNHVNLDTGRAIFPFDMMELQYGQGTHDDAVIDAKRLISEIDTAWLGIRAREWRLAIHYLSGLIAGGPL